MGGKAGFTKRAINKKLKTISRTAYRAATAAAVASNMVRMPEKVMKTISYPSKTYKKYVSQRSLGGRSNATYKGRFNKATRAGKKDITDNYATSGCVNKREISGSISDANICYLTHSTFDPLLISQTVSQAIVRKLLTQAGIEITTPRDFVAPTGGVSVTESLFYMWILTDDVGTTSILGPVQFDADQTTLDGIVNLTGFGGLTFQQYIYQQMTSSTTTFSRAYLSQTDVTNTLALPLPSRNSPVVATFDAQTELMTIMFKSEINIQNRTKSESGSIDSEAVDNQPLKGMLYEFKGGVPQIKDRGQIGTSTFGINRIQVDLGIQLVRGTDLLTGQPNSPYVEPPTPRQFNNCSKAAKVNMDPGSCKKGSIVHTWTGYTSNLLRFKFNTVPRTPVTTYRYLPGKSQMFALEERISTPSLNLITCLYEVQQTVGVKFTSIKKKTIVANYTTATFSNTT